MKLLMISGDISLAKGDQGPFYYMLEKFSSYFERIDIICPPVSEPMVQQIHGNVFVHASQGHLLFHPFFIKKKGLALFKEHRHDLMVVHGYPPFYNEMGALKIWRKTKLPFVLEYHHITGYPRPADLKEKVYLAWSKIFIPRYAKKAIAVRTVNSLQVPEFLKRVGVDEKKIIYIPSFYIDFSVFQPDELVDKKYDLVFCSRLVENKGILNLVKAVKIAKAEIDDVKLVIIGSGPLKKPIEKMVKKNGLQNNISFAGWLPAIEDVADVYRRSRVFVMPSFNEGGPRVSLEAMACGLPVITTRVGIMNEIIENKQNGLFVDWTPEDLAEKIVLVLKNQETIGEMGQQALATVSVFQREGMIKNYAEKLIAMIKE
ncbi:MAG: glycosyltransferase family 4 protein [bacterium]